MRYKLMTNGLVLQLADNDNPNREILSSDPSYLAWLAEGNTPEPAGPVDPSISVSPRQIRQALTAVGLRAQVEAAVASGGQGLQDWWEFSTVIEENHPEVLGMATAMGLTAEQRHDLFVLAGGL